MSVQRVWGSHLVPHWICHCIAHCYGYITTAALRVTVFNIRQTEAKASIADKHCAQRKISQGSDFQSLKKRS